MAILNEAIEKIAGEFGLPYWTMLDHARRDGIGGFPEEWPGGSIWDGEGRILYALIRTTGMRKALELGTGHGCATSHMARALKENGGVLVTVDKPDSIDLASFTISEDLAPNVLRVLEDGIEWTRRNTIGFDLIFEDGPHTFEFTRDAIKAILPCLRAGSFVLVHDVFGPHEEQVWPGLKAALPDAKRVLVDPSPCGLGYWRKPSG